MTPARSPLVEGAPFTSDARLPIAVLASGGGSNLGALIRCAAEPTARFSIAVVVVNVEGAGAIERARAAGIPVVVEPHRVHASRADFERALVRHVETSGARVVVLAGFMRVLTTVFLDAFPSRVVNVHPALLPAFPGMHGAKQALDFGARVTGCTVHVVDAGVDTGPILAQSAVPVDDDDDEASLTARIQAAEHALLPAVVEAIARGNVGFEAGRLRARAVRTKG